MTQPLTTIGDAFDDPMLLGRHFEGESWENAFDIGFTLPNWLRTRSRLVPLRAFAVSPTTTT
jgi:hypothetical protein